MKFAFFFLVRLMGGGVSGGLSPGVPVFPLCLSQACGLWYPGVEIERDMHPESLFDNTLEWMASQATWAPPYPGSCCLVGFV